MLSSGGSGALFVTENSSEEGGGIDSTAAAYKDRYASCSLLGSGSGGMRHAKCAKGNAEHAWTVYSVFSRHVSAICSMAGRHSADSGVNMSATGRNWTWRWGCEAPLWEPELKKANSDWSELDPGHARIRAWDTARSSCSSRSV